jgi:hypothetical protein
MKLFQRLLVAPAALGLMVPMVANASEQLNKVTDRVDSIENSVDGFEAGVFAEQQTKLSGTSVFNLGGVDGGQGGNKSTNDEAVVFNYDTIIDIDSSFSGSDLLRTRLRAANFRATDPFGSDVALQERGFASADSVVINRAFYQFPIGEDFTATFGPMVRQDDMLGVWPSDYPSDTILDVLTYAGANKTYPLTLGAGFGLSYLSDSGRWSASLLSVSSEGNDAIDGGLYTAEANDVVTSQLAYLGDRWTIALANTVADDGQEWGFESNDQYNAWGLSGVYQIDAGRRPTDDITLIPSSISAGIGWSSVIDSDDSEDIEDSRTYSVGIVWTDAFSEGNDFGIAYGTAEDQINDNGYDDPHAWEVYYAMGINDNITVTPAFFQVQKDDEDDLNGVVVKTTFSF